MIETLLLQVFIKGIGIDLGELEQALVGHDIGAILLWFEITGRISSQFTVDVGLTIAFEQAEIAIPATDIGQGVTDIIVADMHRQFDSLSLRGIEWRGLEPKVMRIAAAGNQQQADKQ